MTFQEARRQLRLARREGVLDCSRKQCNQWYRLDIPTPGSLEVRVETHQQGDRPMTRLVVRQIGRDPLGQTMGGTSNVLSVRAKAGEGLYMVLVQAGGKRLPYTVTAVLEITGNERLLESNPVIRRSIAVRNPYVDPINVLQAGLLMLFRKSPDDRVRDALHITINGIAAGLQNTG